MGHTPPLHVTRRLHAYDRELRCRWARHQALWAVEKRMPPRSRQWIREQPKADFEDAKMRDLYEGWRDGYALVMFVHPTLLGAPVMWDTLAAADLHRQGGVDKFADLLDAQDRAAEAAVKHEVHEFNGHMADDVWNRVAWLDGRRVTVPNLEPVEARFPTEAREGYTVVDRRQGAG